MTSRTDESYCQSVKRILNVLKQTNKTKSWNKQFNLKNIKYFLKNTVLFTDLNSQLKHNTQHQFEQILSINDNSQTLYKNLLKNHENELLKLFKDKAHHQHNAHASFWSSRANKKRCWYDVDEWTKDDVMSVSRLNKTEVLINSQWTLASSLRND